MPKLFPKAVSRSCFPKLFPKIPQQSGCPKRLCFKPMFPKVATESCSPKLHFKATSQRCSSFRTAVQNCSASKLLRTAAKLAPKGCFRKRFPKAIVPKAIVRQCCFQSRKIAPHNCSPKLLFKIITAPQNSNAVTRSCLKAGPKSCPKLLPKAAAQSCSPALLPKVVPQSCSPKLLP